MATKVVVRGNLDQALKKFKAKVNKNGIPQETKKHEGYDKPGVRRRAAEKEGKNGELLFTVYRDWDDENILEIVMIIEFLMPLMSLNNILKIIKRNGRVWVICENPKHKQRQG